MLLTSEPSLQSPWIWFYRNRVSLYSPGCPETYSVDQAGLELRNRPASASQVLGLKACATTARLFILFFLRFIYCYMSVHCSCLLTHQKRASDLITDGCEPPCGCWDLNSGPLEDQSVLLLAEPSLQPLTWIFYKGS